MSDMPMVAEQTPAQALANDHLSYPPADPYPYGWREVCETLANGERVWTRRPLTLEDVLHPLFFYFVFRLV
jgi:hypothetical protein